MQVGLLCALTCQFGYTGNGFTFLFGVLYLLQHDFRNQRILVEIVIHLRFDEVAYILIHAYTTGRHGRGTEFGLGLSFKLGFFHIDGNGGNNTVADVGIFLVLVVELLDGAGNMFFKRTLVRSTLCGMLAVDKGIVFLAVLIRMRKGYFNIFSF